MWLRFCLKKSVGTAEQCDHWIWLGPCEPLPLLMFILMTTRLSCYQLKNRSLRLCPFWAEDKSCQDLSVSSLTHLQMYCKAALQGIVWEPFNGSLVHFLLSSSLALVWLKAVFPAQFTLKWLMTFQSFQLHRRNKFKICVSRTKGKAAFDTEGESVTAAICHL